MKAIELSKNYLSEAELGQLNYVQGEYSYAYAKLYGGSYTRYTASVDKTTGKVTWSPKDDKVDKENKKVYIKGARLKLYPKGMRIFRYSKGIKKPSVEHRKYTNIKKEIST